MFATLFRPNLSSGLIPSGARATLGTLMIRPCTLSVPALVNSIHNITIHLVILRLRILSPGHRTFADNISRKLLISELSACCCSSVVTAFKEVDIRNFGCP